MTKFTPVLASEMTAAQLLDMSSGEFRSLVEAGALPRGREIAPGVLRWDVEHLKRIGRGDLASGFDEVEW